METILKLERVYKDFSGLVVLLEVDLEVYEKERHAIIGPNGAGKSTLFNVITGLYKPSKGRIFFHDQEITGWPTHKICRLGLSRSFQIINIFPKMTVFENIRNAIVAKHQCVFNFTTLLNRHENITKESDQMIDLLGLNEVRDVPATELSYGLQRELELALTMARDPIFILLDEPTAGLTIEETRKVVQLVRRITEGKTLVIIEHDMEVVFELADRITVLNYGQILTTGTPKEIRESEAVKKAYLGR